MLLEIDHGKLVEEVADSFVGLCKQKLNARIESLYAVGSYAFGKMSMDRPDLNFLLILSEYATPSDYLVIGEICREIPKDFRKHCSVRVEFRPFRYIYPKIRSSYDVFLNPIIVSTNEIRMRGMIFSKWFTEGMKGTNKLLFGKDFLPSVSVGTISKQDIFQGALFDLPFFTIPLTRAPAQYDDDECDLLFNEALTNGKNICYLGIEIAMNENELKEKKYLNYIENKETIADFYNEHYGKEASKIVATIFEAREHYLEYKNCREKADEMFDCALRIADHVQRNLFQMMR